MTRRAIFTADDFGLSVAVNEGIEQAHRDGVLSCASLMVAGPAAADAVRRAKRLPGLRVGLHLTVIEGPAVLPPAALAGLVGADGRFGSDQVGRGVSYFFRPAVRQRLRAEIQAQFRAFAATGLTLDHANAHKHMHLHPTVGGFLLDVGRDHGLRAVRVPNEPALANMPDSAGAWAMRAWCGVLRGQARRAGMISNDQVFGLAWTGAMTEARVLSVLAQLPAGVSEIYFHPAAGRDGVLDALMPTYRHEDELAALCSPAVRTALAAASVPVIGFGDVVRPTRA